MKAIEITLDLFYIRKHQLNQEIHDLKIKVKQVTVEGSSEHDVYVALLDRCKVDLQATNNNISYFISNVFES